MSLPITTEGKVVFFTQRIDGRPFVNCMMYSLCSVLRWMGYDVPVDFGMTLRRASGRTLYADGSWTGHLKDPDDKYSWVGDISEGKPQGTNIADTRRALAKLLPEAPVLYGSLTNNEFIAELEAGAAIRVTGKCPAFPKYLRRWVGSFPGSHAFAVIGTRVCNGGPGRHDGHIKVREVFWMDPMGRPDVYKGEWVPFTDIAPAVSRNAEGKIIVTLGYKDAVVKKELPPEEETEVNLTELFDLVGFRGSVAAKSPVLNPADKSVVTRVGATEDARLIGPLPDGKHYAILVSTTKLPGTGPHLLLVGAQHVTGPDDEIESLKHSVAALSSQIDADKALRAEVSEDIGGIAASLTTLVNRLNGIEPSEPEPSEPAPTE